MVSAASTPVIGGAYEDDVAPWRSVRGRSRPWSEVDLDAVDIHPDVARFWIRRGEDGEFKNMLAAWKNRALPAETALMAFSRVLVNAHWLATIDRDQCLSVVRCDDAIEADAGADEPHGAGIAGHARVRVRAGGLKVARRVAPGAVVPELIEA